MRKYTSLLKNFDIIYNRWFIYNFIIIWILYERNYYKYRKKSFGTNYHCMPHIK